jgi:excisionase family DNA binding protein
MPPIRRFDLRSYKMPQQLLISEEVAEILHVSRSFAYLLMKRGDIPTVHVGNAVRVRPEDLERYINNNATRDEPGMSSTTIRGV